MNTLTKQCYSIANVPDGTTTTKIQQAIDASSIGDKIKVAAGNYDETVKISQGMTLEGAGSGTTVIL